MGGVNCSRCNVEAYGGEIRIVIDHTEYTYSLCSYCLPIIQHRLTGFMQEQIAPWQTMDAVERKVVPVEGQDLKDLEIFPRPDFLIDKFISSKE